MRISDIVLEKLKHEGKKQTWLADKLNIPNSTLNSKLIKDTFSAIEIIKIDILLGLDYFKIKQEVEEEMKEVLHLEKLQIISDWLLKGMTSGYYPNWNLEVNVSESELTEADFEIISNQVLEGFTSGSTANANWSICIE